MSYSREGRSVSPRNSGSPGRGRRSRSLSRPRRSRSSINGSGGASNPGNNLYITGLSTRITSSDLEKYFNSEGKVLECHLAKRNRGRTPTGHGRGHRRSCSYSPRRWDDRDRRGRSRSPYS
ncbi:hypothetical protein Peur_040567 [Populus x canadensis]